MRIRLTGRYVDKTGALEILHSMNLRWTKRQIDWTAEPDPNGNRKWPWFKDPANGKLLIDAGFIVQLYQSCQKHSLQIYGRNEIK